jgi:hypothetical protein
MRDVLLVTISEFGRTVRENGNRGTDHGHGGVMFVLDDRLPDGPRRDRRAPSRDSRSRRYLPRLPPIAERIPGIPLLTQVPTSRCSTLA